MKKCIKCGEVKPFSEFCKDKTRADGLNNKCKKCVKQYNTENKEYFKNYYTENKDKIKGYKKAYDIKNKDRIKEFNKNYYTENKDKIKECHKKYRIENKDKINEINKKYIDKLSDSYIKGLLAKNSPLKPKDFNDQPELIDLKRLQIQTERLCKTSKS